MNEIITFFEELTSLQKLTWIFIVLVVCWFLEAGMPLLSMKYDKLRHIGVNLVFLATTLLVNFIFGLAILGIFVWLNDHQFGLLNWVDLPIWIELIIAIMIFDFVAQYIVHYLLHRVKWMWKLHMVHHSDTHVDATTGTRHHPGDYFMRELFSLFAIVIAGMPLAFYVIYRVTSVFTTYFTHANIRLPNWLDKSLSLVFVTPNMHKFHHHFERPWTDTNFGNIFSIWDRMFGTMVYDDPSKVVYGLDVLDNSKDENIVYQFTVPFDKNIKTDY